MMSVRVQAPLEVDGLGELCLGLLEFPLVPEQSAQITERTGYIQMIAKQPLAHGQSLAVHGFGLSQLFLVLQRGSKDGQRAGDIGVLLAQANLPHSQGLVSESLRLHKVV